EFYGDDRREMLTALRSGLRDGTLSTLDFLQHIIEKAVDAAIRREGLLVAKGTPKYRELCLTLQQAWIQALERTGERDEGFYDGKPTDDIVIPPNAPATAQAAPGKAIMEQFEVYEKANPNGIKADTLNY